MESDSRSLVFLNLDKNKSSRPFSSSFLKSLDLVIRRGEELSFSSDTVYHTLYMKTYLIGYDLNKPDKDYTKLIENIKKISDTWWHHLDSTWIIKSNATAEQIRNYLSPYIDSNDELLVVRLEGEAAWIGFNQTGSTWLKDNISFQ